MTPKLPSPASSSSSLSEEDEEAVSVTESLQQENDGESKEEVEQEDNGESKEEEVKKKLREEEDQGQEQNLITQGKDKSASSTSKSVHSESEMHISAERPLEIISQANDSKRAKRKLFDEVNPKENRKQQQEGELSKKLIQRIWSAEDEIALLQGIISYKSNVGPMEDMKDFYNFVKKSLHFNFNKSQVDDKIRRLHIKFKNNDKRSQKGKNLYFTKLHESKLYRLSKKIWGFSGVNVDLAKIQFWNDNEKGKSSEVVKGKMSQIVWSSIELGLDKHIMEGLIKLDSVKKLGLEEKWKKLKMNEIELFIKRIELVREQLRLILDAYKA